MNDIPRTTSPSDQPAVEPDIVEAVRHSWSQVLNIDVADIDPTISDFFQIGGYSLLALQAISGLLEASDGGLAERAFEVEGRLLDDLFDRPFCIDQARILADEGVSFPAEARTAITDAV